MTSDPGALDALRGLRVLNLDLLAMVGFSVSLAFFQGLSHSEVASHLGKPLGTVKTHIRRGLLKLKGCLES